MVTQYRLHQRKSGIFYHRVKVPIDIRQHYGKEIEQVSLGTRDPREAVRRLPAVIVQVDRLFSRFREDQTQAGLCSPKKPKYVKGHLLWSKQSGALYAVGHCCGHNFFAEGSLAIALNRNSNLERRKTDEAFIERNWDLPRRLVSSWTDMKPAVRDLDRVLRAIRDGLTNHRCRDIQRTTREGGFLKIQEAVPGMDEGPEGLKTVERAFGARPVRGASVLRGGKRGVSVEGKLLSLVSVLSRFGWGDQDDAILWICEQADEDVARLASFIRDAIDGFKTAVGDIEALLTFLEKENLKLISDWSREAHGRGGAIDIQNDDGHISIYRGGKRHQNFRLPTTLLVLWSDMPDQN